MKALKEFNAYIKGVLSEFFPLRKAAQFAHAANPQYEVVGLILLVERLRRKLLQRQERADQRVGEFVSDFAADQSQDLGPFRVVAVLAEDGVQIRQLEVRGLLEAADVFRGRQEFHECPVQEAVQLRAARAQQVVLLPQARHHQTRRLAGLDADDVGKRILEPRLRQLQQFFLADEISPQSCLAALHSERDSTQQVLFVLLVQQRHGFAAGLVLFAEVLVDLPVVDQDVDALFVEASLFAGQFLLAGDQAHDRQQQRIARQPADRRRPVHAAQHTFDPLFGVFFRVREDSRKPAACEGLLLVAVQILQPEVSKTGRAQDTFVVPVRTARHDDARFGIVHGDADDLLHNLIAVTLVEDFVEAVEQQQ